MKPTSFRLPESTIAQLRALAARFGMTLTQALIVAVDRLAQSDAQRSQPKP